MNVSLFFVIRRKKNNLDLEPSGVECIWVELTLKQKHILFGLFYRPPNSDMTYYSLLEDSTHLAVDTGIADIIITGDFNMLNSQYACKINSLCQQFSLYQSISEPTHFTENSSSLIDLLLVSNKDRIIFSGVGDPFLQQYLRYHCPVFGVFNFSKPKIKCFKRRVWQYDRGDYDLLKQKAYSSDWNSPQNPEINVYAKNFYEHLIELTNSCIPNRQVTIRPTEPPWITTLIKKHIRMRKRAYKKAKRTNTQANWVKFRRLRNETTSMIRNSKKSYIDSLSNKLKSENLSSKQWWTVLKTFISPTSTSTIPPLEKNGLVYSDEVGKANIFNDLFRD